ncbi:MAG: hypothetical protein ACJAQ4_002739 [Cryomorphaceae bacterium]|jgi:hypothetical protein
MKIYHSALTFSSRNSERLYSLEIEPPMKLSKTAKVLTGIFTILQLFAALGFVVWLIATVVPQVISAGDNPGPEFALSVIGGMLVWIIFLTIYSVGFMIFYLLHAGTNRETSTGVKILWIALILVFQVLAQVVYYFLEILPEQSLTAKLEN